MSSEEQERTREQAEPGFLTGTILGIIVGIPMALLSLVVSLGLPVLVVMALLLGPSATWAKLQAWTPGHDEVSSACQGFDAWDRESQERGDAFTQLPVSEGMSPAQAEETAAELDDLADAQRESDPPERATELNRLYVESYALNAEGLRALADGDQARVREISSDLSALTPVIEQEHREVVLECGG